MIEKAYPITTGQFVIGGKPPISFSAVIYREEDTYVAKCPEVGTVSQGKSIEEALKNLKEATELYLEEFPFKPSNPQQPCLFQSSWHSQKEQH